MFSLRLNLSNLDNASYLGHKAIVLFTRRQWLDGKEKEKIPLDTPGSLTQNLPPSGDVTLTLPPREELSSTIVVRMDAPDGEVLHEAWMPADKPHDLMRLQVVPKRYAETSPNTDPTFGNQRAYEAV